MEITKDTAAIAIEFAEWLSKNEWIKNQHKNKRSNT